MGCVGFDFSEVQKRLPVWFRSLYSRMLSSCFPPIQVVVDQLTYGPVCNLAAMAYISLMVEGEL